MKELLNRYPKAVNITLIVITLALIVLSAFWLWQGIEKHTQANKSQSSGSVPATESSGSQPPVQDAGGRDAYRQFESQ